MITRDKCCFHLLFFAKKNVSSLIKLKAYKSHPKFSQKYFLKIKTKA